MFNYAFVELQFDGPCFNLARSRSGKRIALVASLAVVMFLSLANCVDAEEKSVAKNYTKVVERNVERALREVSNRTAVAGFGFGVVQGSATVLECYSGFASKESDRRIDASSIFHWASLSKSVTAVCALRLAELGKFDLDSDIRNLVPELKLGSSVSARQILSMRGGFGDYESYPELLDLASLDRERVTSSVILEKMAPKGLVFAPGEKVGYSSPGYIVLSIALERATGAAFGAIVAEHVASPLDLKTLRVGGKSKFDVSRYRIEGETRVLVPQTYEDWRMGAGSISSSLSDALRYCAALIESSLLTPESSRELFRSHAMLKADGDESIGLAYGFTRVGKGQESVLSASGKQPGTSSILTIFPNEKIATLLFANTTPVDLESIQEELITLLEGD
jgi:serine beta-lactamase-like protein LACTB